MRWIYCESAVAARTLAHSLASTAAFGLVAVDKQLEGAALN